MMTGRKINDGDCNLVPHSAGYTYDQLPILFYSLFVYNIPQMLYVDFMTREESLVGGVTSVTPSHHPPPRLLRSFGRDLSPFSFAIYAYIPFCIQRN